MADLYVFLVDEAPATIRKDTIECMTHFAKTAVESIHAILQNDNAVRAYLSQPAEARGPRPAKLAIVEKLIYSALVVGSVVNEVTMFGSQLKRLGAAWDFDSLSW